MNVVPETPETVEVTNCAVAKVELPGGAMVLSFVIPGIRRYNFVLDSKGREMIATLCRRPLAFGPNNT